MNLQKRLMQHSAESSAGSYGSLPSGPEVSMGHLCGQQLVISLQHISEEMMEVCGITTLRYLKFCKTWQARLLRCVAFRHVTLQCARGMSESCSLTDEDTIPAWTCVLRGDSRKAGVSQCPVWCEALTGTLWNLMGLKGILAARWLEFLCLGRHVWGRHGHCAQAILCLRRGYCS